MKYLHTCIKSLLATTLIAISVLHCRAGDTVIVESRKADGTPNVPAWTEVSGKWTTSKNKSRVSRTMSLTATNVSVSLTNIPAPAFKVSPTGLEAGATYQVEVTFSTSGSYVAAPDLRVTVAATGVSATTIPTNTPAFQGSGADGWNVLGTVTLSTNSPTLMFTYAGGTLSKESRWYADAIRFTRQAASK
ncbi:MAG: hypothetical protein AAB370_02205 [Verrucomicrobiota bacterium]